MKELVTRIKLESKEFTKDLETGKGAALAFSAAIGTAVAGMAFLATNTANTVENNTKLARAAGENTKEFSQLAFAAKLGGVEIESLSQGMAKMAKADSQKNLRAMGIAVTDTNGKLRSQNEILLDLSALIQKTEDPLKRLQLAQAALGRSGGQYLEFLKEGPEGIRALMKEAEELGQVFTEQDAAAADLFNDKLDTLKSGVDGLGLSIGKSIIQWVNQSGAMDAATKIVKAAIAAWNSIDESTKDFIFTFAAAAAGVTLFGGALYGIYTIAPLVGAALKAAFITNPIGLLITAIALVVAAVIRMYKNWEQFAAFFAPLKQMFNEFKVAAGSAVGFVSEIFQRLGRGLSPLKGTFDSIKDAFKNVDLVSSGLKLTLAPLLITFYSLALVVGILTEAFQAFFRILNSDFGGGMAEFLLGTSTGNIIAQVNGVNRMREAWGGMSAEVSTAVRNMNARLDKFSGNVKQTIKNIATAKTELEPLLNAPPPPGGEDPFANDKKDKVKSYSNEIYGFVQNVGKAVEALRQLDDKGNDTVPMLEKIADSMEFAKAALQTFASSVTNVFSADAKLEQTRLTNFTQKNQFMTKAIAAFEEVALQAQQDRLSAEIAQLNAQKDALIESEIAYQESLKEIRSKYAEERSAELDAELQKEFELLDARYQSQVDMLEKAGIIGLELDARKSDLLAENEDRKNQLITQSNKKLQKDIEKKNKELDADEAKKAKEKKQREDDILLHIQMLEEQKAAAAAASAEKKAMLEKASRLMEWKAGMAAFETGKRAQMAQVVTGMAMSTMNAIQAGILLAATVPVVGWVLGPILAGTLTALAVAAGSRALSSVASQQYPPPPLFDDGGISRGKATGNGWRSEDAEMHIPLNNPGKDFGALKEEVAKLLLPDDFGGRRVSIENLQVINTFGGRDDYEEIRDRINADIKEMVKGALES